MLDFFAGDALCRVIVRCLGGIVGLRQSGVRGLLDLRKRFRGGTATMEITAKDQDAEVTDGRRRSH